MHILPPFLKSLAGEEDSLVDLAVDNVRQVTYAITAKGVLSAFYLGNTGTETTLFLSSFNVLDAARTHLTVSRSLPEGSPKPESFANTTAPGFNVLSLHVLPLTESKKVHVVAVLGNGIRIYLSLLTANRGLFNYLPGPQQQSGNYSVPGGVEVAYVRSPPSPAALRVCGNSSGRLSSASAPDGIHGAGGAGRGRRRPALPAVLGHRDLRRARRREP